MLRSHLHPTPLDGVSNSPTSDGARQLSRVYEPIHGWRSVDLRELWRYRELLYFLVWRDVKVRYKQTVLGGLWAINQPLLTMIVFTIFFGRLGSLDRSTSVPYPLFVYAGLLPWQFFSAAITDAGQSLVTSANLISKVYFPRLLIPLSTVGHAAVDFLVACSVLFGMLFYYRVPATPQLLWMPLFMAGAAVAAVGVGAWLAALTIVYRDFRYIITFAIQLWMLCSPVAYPVDVVPDRYVWVYSLNPMVGWISGFRSAVLGEPVQWSCVAIATAVSGVLFVTGALYFRRIERRFADII